MVERGPYKAVILGSIPIGSTKNSGLKPNGKAIPLQGIEKVFDSLIRYQINIVRL